MGTKIEARQTLIGTDVYEEAKKRIEKLFYMYDNLVVAFSGGKDSLALLNLVKEVYDEMGIKKKVNVLFRDEELIPDDVIAFVEEYRQKDWINMLWFATEMESEKFILGKKYKYLQWDKARKNIREKPAGSITLMGVVDQYSMDCIVKNYFKGKIAVLTGVRASESLIRLQATMNKKGIECYINKTQEPLVNICKPLYDWSENDIFKYFYDKDIKYCKIYDIQHLNEENLRVSTPLHAESSKEFHKIKTRYPTFYQQLVNTFPEMKLQERYWKDYSKDSQTDKYEMTYRGILDYIDENLDPVVGEKVRKKVMIAHGMHSRFGGYPAKHIFKQVLNGAYKRQFMPDGKRTQVIEGELLDFTKNRK